MGFEPTILLHHPKGDPGDPALERRLLRKWFVVRNAEESSAPPAGRHSAVIIFASLLSLIYDFPLRNAHLLDEFFQVLMLLHQTLHLFPHTCGNIEGLGDLILFPGKKGSLMHRPAAGTKAFFVSAAFSGDG